MNPPSPPPPAVKNPAAVWPRRLPRLGGGLLIALVVAGLWPRPVPVETAVVARGPLVVTVDEEGMTRVRNRYLVSAPVAGHLRRIDWKAGAPVGAGQTVLAVIEGGGADFLDARTQTQAEARVRTAGAARDAAAAQRERAAAADRMYLADYARLKELFAQKALSRQEFDAAQMRADMATQDTRTADFALKVAEYELEQAHAVLGRGAKPAADAAALTVTSPVDGMILRVLQESERLVPAGFPLMEIGDPTDLEIRIEVLSRDGVAIRPGARVMLERWGGPDPLAARVRLVEPAAFTKVSALGVEEQRVNVLIDLRNNGGGSLIEAVELTGLFIDKGPVVQQRTAEGREQAPRHRRLAPRQLHQHPHQHAVTEHQTHQAHPPAQRRVERHAGGGPEQDPEQDDRPHEIHAVERHGRGGRRGREAHRGSALISARCHQTVERAREKT